MIRPKATALPRPRRRFASPTGQLPRLCPMQCHQVVHRIGTTTESCVRPAQQSQRRSSLCLGRNLITVFLTVNRCPHHDAATTRRGTTAHQLGHSRWPAPHTPRRHRPPATHRRKPLGNRAAHHRIAPRHRSRHTFQVMPPCQRLHPPAMHPASSRSGANRHGRWRAARKCASRRCLPARKRQRPPAGGRCRERTGKRAQWASSSSALA